MVVYFLAAMDDKEEYLATTQFFFFTTGAYTMILRNINGIYTPDRYGDNEEDRLCIFVTFGNCNIIIVNRRHLVYTVYEVGYRGDADGR